MCTTPKYFTILIEIRSFDLQVKIEFSSDPRRCPAVKAIVEKSLKRITASTEFEHIPPFLFALAQPLT